MDTTVTRLTAADVAARVCATQHHHVHHGHWISAEMGMESPLPLMDLDDETKMLEEDRDAFTFHLEKVNKRINALKR